MAGACNVRTEPPKANSASIHLTLRIQSPFHNRLVYGNSTINGFPRNLLSNISRGDARSIELPFTSDDGVRLARRFPVAAIARRELQKGMQKGQGHSAPWPSFVIQSLAASFIPYRTATRTRYEGSSDTRFKNAAISQRFTMAYGAKVPSGKPVEISQ